MLLCTRYLTTAASHPCKYFVMHKLTCTTCWTSPSWGTGTVSVHKGASGSILTLTNLPTTLTKAISWTSCRRKENSRRNIIDWVSQAWENFTNGRSTTIVFSHMLCLWNCDNIGKRKETHMQHSTSSTNAKQQTHFITRMYNCAVVATNRSALQALQVVPWYPGAQRQEPVTASQVAPFWQRHGDWQPSPNVPVGHAAQQDKTHPVTSMRPTMCHALLESF